MVACSGQATLKDLVSLLQECASNAVELSYIYIVASQKNKAGVL